MKADRSSSLSRAVSLEPRRESAELEGQRLPASEVLDYLRGQRVEGCLDSAARSSELGV
jgi:hypothetical protein